MYNDLIDQISKYMGEGEEFAVAQVICREAPSSGKPGDKAIILKDGTMIGWIGGGCVKGIAVKEAQEAIRENRSRLVDKGQTICGHRRLWKHHQSYDCTRSNTWWLNSGNSASDV